jgi:hypothetical protein
MLSKSISFQMISFGRYTEQFILKMPSVEKYPTEYGTLETILP